MASKRPATGSDVARLAGVSKSAVSRAYTGGYVSPGVKKRIFDAARELRYRPSIAARALSTNRSAQVGLAITALDNLYYPELVDHLSDALAAAGLRPTLFTTHGQADLEPVLDELLGFRLDGVILASTSFARRAAAECSEAGIPAIMLINTDLDERIAGVCADNRHGCEAIASHLLERGYRRFAVINGLAESSASVERTRFFSEALEARGAAAPTVLSGQYSFEGTEAATRTLLAQARDRLAIFCTTDLMALACLQTVQTDGLRPGKDVGVAGFDDAPLSRWPAFSLTTYAVPPAQLAQRAVARLVAAIGGQPLAPATDRLRGELKVRNST